MSAEQRSPRTRLGKTAIYVDSFTNGVLDPALEMLGPLQPGGRVVAQTAPGCWGPMITPAIRGGHEVTQPVAVEGAEVGDAVVIWIDSITVSSLATASGSEREIDGRFLGDACVAGRCPGCGVLYPPTHLEGIGPMSVRCDACGADATPFVFTKGYTIVFDDMRTVGVTVDRASAEHIAADASKYAALPKGSIQNPILAFAPHDLVGMVGRLKPFLGQLGTMPAVALPDSHNSGDFAPFLVGAPHEYAISAEALELRTDGHMDINAVRAGAVLVCPVKTPGAGVYLGDMHALQGDGEIAGHTCDVAGVVELHIDIIKGLTLDGPILFPVVEDLPRLARPLSGDERSRAQALADLWSVPLERTAPISVVGTGPDLNTAIDNGLNRAANLLDVDVAEIANRATVTGAIEIGRLPGVVHVTFRAPLDRLERVGLLPIVEQQYTSDDV
jgi:formamidase